MVHQPSFRSFPGTEEITLWKHPGLTLHFFSGAIHDMIVNTKWPFSVERTQATILMSALCFSVHHFAKEGHLLSLLGIDLQAEALWLQDLVLETLFWFGCGFLSTAGLGSGVQTGALFLFPHVCRVALRWSAKQMEAQESTSDEESSLASLLWAVFWPGFWSGGGSALGDLIPFIIARLIREAGGDPFALLNLDSGGSDCSDTEDESEATREETPPSTPLGSKSKGLGGLPRRSSTPNLHLLENLPEPETTNKEGSLRRVSSDPNLNLMDNTRKTMEGHLQENAFWKVFCLAVVPNAVFDLAGLVCGASESVTMSEFFVATWAAKALVRTPLQTCGLALAVVAIASPSSLSMAASHAPLASSSEGTGNVLAQILKPRMPQAPAAEEETRLTSLGGLQTLLQKWGNTALAKFVGDDEEFQGMFSVEEKEELSGTFDMVIEVIKTLWSVVTVFLFVYFIISTIEQIAQHHVRTHPDLQHYHQKNAKQKKRL